jgi:hypothetical protein
MKEVRTADACPELKQMSLCCGSDTSITVSAHGGHLTSCRCCPHSAYFRCSSLLTQLLTLPTVTFIKSGRWSRRGIWGAWHSAVRFLVRAMVVCTLAVWRRVLKDGVQLLILSIASLLLSSH